MVMPPQCLRGLMGRVGSQLEQGIFGLDNLSNMITNQLFEKSR